MNIENKCNSFHTSTLDKQVRHPLLAAVGFTGSLRAGRALMDVAASRDRPIPVYAEMGSVNPIFVMPHAMETRWETIANGLCGSLTMGVGQFCTNPGLIVVSKESGRVRHFKEHLARVVDRVPSGMCSLTSLISFTQ